jgi:hypothetical protein
MMLADDEEDAEPSRKRAAKRAKPAKPVVKALVSKTKTTRSGVVLKKKDFVDRVAEKSGVKKADARSVVDTALTILSEALAAGDEVALPPLGRVRKMVTKDNGKIRAMTLRVQAISDGDTGNEPLADSQD